MKANRHTAGKPHKWKDARGCRRGPASKSSDPGSSPAGVRAAKKPPSVKRLKKNARPVESTTVCSGSERKKPSPHVNGGLAQTGAAPASPEEDPLDWQDAAGGRVEGEALHHCAQRDVGRNRAVLVLQKDQTLCFRGKCVLTCLYGRVEVMGFTVEEGQKSYPVFSPASHCPLSIRAVEMSRHGRDGRVEALRVLQAHLPPASRKKLLKKVMPASSIVLLEPVETSLTRFLSSFTDLRELFGLSGRELMSAILDTPLNALGVIPLSSAVEGLKTSRSCRDALNVVVSACRGDVDGGVVVLVCGVRNVGKSTFIRVLINTLLNHTTSVEYMEGDVGQTEFTPAGCLSLLTVSEPLLGPPFTHQHTPDHMIYYGQSSAESQLDLYLECLKSLWCQRSQSREMPLIINTMGWVKGLGFQLLVDMIRFFSVTHVVQLGHGGTTQCPALTPEFLRTAHGYQTHPLAQSTLDEFSEGHRPPWTFSHLAVQSEFQGVGCQGTSKHQRTNEHRELSLLAYLSQLQSPDPGPVRPLHSLTPYQVPTTAVALGVVHAEVTPPHMFYAANGRLVGLCCLAEKVTSKGGPVLLSQTPVCPCVGFGVLRGIDTARGLYFLLTPVDPSVLRRVNCLLLGEVSLPSYVLAEQPGFEGDVPYVTTDYSFELTGAGKLRQFKGLMRPSQLGQQ